MNLIIHISIVLVIVSAFVLTIGETILKGLSLYIGV